MANKSHGSKIKYKVYVRIFDTEQVFRVSECETYNDNLWQLTLPNGKEVYVPIDKTIIEEI
ncbi:MAG: hypothetical protein V3U54_08620 [Thermodesulfobacteriota bacterium]